MMRSGPLITSKEIRHALGRLYRHLIKKFDLKSSKRRTTPKAAILCKWAGRNIVACAACGANKAQHANIQSAHIEPLYAGASTSYDNLIPLCDDGRNNSLSCHKLFDDEGCASINEMTEWRKGWIDRVPHRPFRQLMVRRHRKYCRQRNNVEDLIRKAYWGQACDLAVTKMHSARSAERKLKWKLKIVEIQRRRSSKDGLKSANATYNRLPRKPQCHRSLCHYEGGYLRLIEGDCTQAKKLFLTSRRSVNRRGRKWRGKWGAATTLSLMCDAAMKSAYPQNLRRLRYAIDVLSHGSDLLSKRWMANCKWNKVRLLLAAKQFGKADAACAEAYEHWKSLHVGCGWEKSFVPAVLTIRGWNALQNSMGHEGANEALSLLTRALVLILGKKMGRPEGIRDILFGLSQGLSRLNNARGSKTLRRIGERIKDGCSWLQPFKKT